MALSILQRPYQTIDGLASKWNAIGNPLIYRMSTPSFAQSNYRLEIYVFDGNDTALNTDAFIYTPDTSGNILVDITTIVRANMSPDNGISLGNTNVEMYDDTNAYKKFYIKYKEVWTGSANSLISDSANQFYAVLGAMQIPSTYGGNLYEYTVFSVTDYTNAKWLTILDRVVMWRGWPFTVSAIIDVSLTASLMLRVKRLGYFNDVSGEQLNQSGKLVDCTYGWLADARKNDNTEAVLNISDFATGDIDYMIDLPVDFKDVCNNPVMLMGRNRLGGVLMWMFDGVQEYEWDYGNGIKNKRLVLHANSLTINQWEALQDFITLGDVYRNTITEFTSSTIKNSSKIGQQVYVVDQDGTKTGVIVINTKNKTKTNRQRHKFEIEIEYPEVFTA